jgi:hypothetical protein
LTRAVHTRDARGVEAGGDEQATSFAADAVRLLATLGELREQREQARQRTREPVPAELLALVSAMLDTEREYAERFNLRASGLIGFAAVLLGLALTVALDAFDRMHPMRGTPPLRLGGVGTPLFGGCFVVALVLLLAAAVIALTALLPTKVARMKMATLREFAERRTPLEQVRERTYRMVLAALEDQREVNRRKGARLRAAALPFVAGTLLVAVDAGTLAITQLKL